MSDKFLCAIILDENGKKGFYQFDNEQELRYFLVIHDDYKLLKVE